jgi:hypothetical protein
MRIFYLRDRNKRPVACVACVAVSQPEGDLVEVKFSVSTWNPVDPFDRKVGRALAIGRLHDYTNDSAIRTVSCRRWRVKENILWVISDRINPQYPQRAREAARNWLRADALLKKVEKELRNIPEPPEGLLDALLQNTKGETTPPQERPFYS